MLCCGYHTGGGSEPYFQAKSFQAVVGAPLANPVALTTLALKGLAALPHRVLPPALAVLPAAVARGRVGERGGYRV